MKTTIKRHSCQRHLCQRHLCQRHSCLGCTVVRQDHCHGSSIDWAKEHFYDVPDGTMFVANTYGQARGRQGRAWQLYPGQVIMTIVLKPEMQGALQESASTRLTMALTVGVADVLREYGVGVKWPNDFVYVAGDGQTLKVGGILLTCVWRANKVEGFIAGIGINVTNEFLPGDDLFGTATSLQGILNKSGDDTLLKAADIHDKLVESLGAWYGVWRRSFSLRDSLAPRSGDLDKIFSHWRSSQCCIGKTISVHYKDGRRVVGCMLGVASCGGMLFCPKQQEVADTSTHEIVPLCCVEDIVFVSNGNT